MDFASLVPLDVLERLPEVLVGSTVVFDIVSSLQRVQAMREQSMWQKRLQLQEEQQGRMDVLRAAQEKYSRDGGDASCMQSIHLERKSLEVPYA